MFKPDFLIIPYAIKECDALRPTDGDIYAVVYWFERLKDGICKASNETIGDIARCDARTVRGALDRLERNSFIIRIYEDPETRKVRKEIRTLVSYQRNGQGVTGLPGPVGPEPKEETPGEVARRFFTIVEGESNQLVEDIINSISQKTGAPEEVITQEVRKFIFYWTEPNKSGTKVRWQTEKTFEVQRRLYTWLNRAGKIQQTHTRAGSGRVV